MFHTAIVLSKTSSHPSHLWNLKKINIFGWRLEGDMLVCGLTSITLLHMLFTPP